MTDDGQDQSTPEVKALTEKVVTKVAMDFVYRQALAGDQGFAMDGISYIVHKLDARERLNGFDHRFLRELLYRISRSPQAMNVISGAPTKRGRAKDGPKGLRIARAIRAEISSSGVTVEEAWERVAEKEHLSASMVKRYWIKWKGPLHKTIEEAVLLINLQKDRLTAGSESNRLLDDGEPKP